MPSSLPGILLFIVLLFPGYLFERRRESDLPDRIRTPFKETLSVVFVGVVTDSVMLSFAAVFSVWGPTWVPDPVALLINPRNTFTDHPLRAVGLVLWTVGGACALAYLCAARPWSDFTHERWPHRHRSRSPRGPGQSAWWVLFHAKPDHRLYVGCYLDDGSYVGGLLYSYNRAEAETADREVTLRANAAFPLRHRSSWDRPTQVLEDVGVVAVSARRIVMLTATYLEPPAPTGGS